MEQVVEMPDRPKSQRRGKASNKCAAVVAQAETLYKFQRMLWAVRYTATHLPVRRDNNAVASNLPVVNIPLLSPAFTDLSSVPVEFHHGTKGPTDHSVLEGFMRSIAQKNPWARFQLTTFQSEQGRTLSYLHLSNSFGLDGVSDNKKLKVWIQGGVHGNEPAGDQSVLALLGKMDADQAWSSMLLNVMEIIVLPRYNPDGVDQFQRLLESYLDANRDHIRLASQQTRDIKTMFNAFAPHLVIDMHEYKGSQTYGGHYHNVADVLLSSGKNLNIHPNIRELSERLFIPGIGKRLEDSGFRWEPYVTGNTNTTSGSSILFHEASSDAKIGRNAMGLTQSIVFLCETRGIGLADQHFHRRTAAALTVLEAFLQIAADHTERVYNTVKDAIREFANGSDDIVVTDRTTLINRTFTMVDFRTGAISQVPIRFASTTPVIAELTRRRPEAYLIPSAWTEVAERLRLFGLIIQLLDSTFSGTVEVLRITSTKFHDTYYEGIAPVTVTTASVDKYVELPAGTYVLSTRQRNAALAFAALEPENVDSYVSTNIIPVEVGEDYPIFRLMC